MAKQIPSHGKPVRFWHRYVEERGIRNADLAPYGDGRLFQGGRTQGVPEGNLEHEITKGSPVGRFGRPTRGRHIIRIKR